MWKRISHICIRMLGTENASAGELAYKVLGGVVAPTVIALYAIECIMSGHAWFIGRFGLLQVHKLAATSVGVCYMASAAFLHFHFVWTHHPVLDGLSDPARYLALIVVGLSIAFTLVGVLI